MCVSWTESSRAFAQRSFLGALRNTKPGGLDEARKDIELWAFIQTVAPLTQKSNRLRHWGGECSFHETELLCGRKVACEWKGHAPSVLGFGHQHLLSLVSRFLG